MWRNEVCEFCTVAYIIWFRGVAVWEYGGMGV